MQWIIAFTLAMPPPIPPLLHNITGFSKLLLDYFSLDRAAIWLNRRDSLNYFFTSDIIYLYGHAEVCSYLLFRFEERL